MTLKTLSAFLTLSLLLTACGQPARRSSQCVMALETSAKVSTVNTLSGPVAGYVDYLYY